MDKSKMAKTGTKITYDPFKEDYGQDQMSRRVKQRCGTCCWEDGCHCEKSLDDVLDGAEDEKIGCNPCTKS